MQRTEHPVYKKDLFKNQVMVISGGTSKMLLQAAEDFLLLGGKVALLSRRQEKLDKIASNFNNALKEIRVRGYQADVRKFEELEKVIDQILKDFGQIDVLVNGAAGNFLVEAEKLTTNGYKTVMDIDSTGTFNLSRAVYIKWFKLHGGSIVNISASLHHMGTLLNSHAASAKAAVDALTKTLALEWGPKNVRVNGLAPGLIAGSEGLDRLSDVSKVGKTNSKETDKTNETKDKSMHMMMEEASSMLPLQRFGNKNDVSDGILFLASPASSYITGQTILMDGGQLAVLPNWLVLDPKFKKMWRAKF